MIETRCTCRFWPCWKAAKPQWPCQAVGFGSRHFIIMWLLSLPSFLVRVLEYQMHNHIDFKYIYLKDVKFPMTNSAIAQRRTFWHNIYISPLYWIFFTYYKMIFSILRIPTSGGKYKFSPSVCLSGQSFAHFMVQKLECTWPVVSYGPRKRVVGSVLFTVVTLWESLHLKQEE
jgi:hypothetical protein